MNVNDWVPYLYFEQPGYLALLVVLPLVVLMSLRSLAALGPIRRTLAIVFRCAVIACMVLALAGAETVRESDALGVIFAIDRSNSVPRAEQERAFSFMQECGREIDRLRDVGGIVAFDGVAAVEQLPLEAGAPTAGAKPTVIRVDQLSGAIDPDETNIAGALRKAMALFQADISRRIVLLSDGNENLGQTLEEVEYVAAAGVRVDVLPIHFERGNEVIFERLDAPATANEDETIALQMVLRSEQTVRGQILLYQNDRLLDLDPQGAGSGYAVTLEPGPNRLTVPIPLRAGGIQRFQARFEPESSAVDAIASNNEGRAFTVVSGQGKILILTQGASATSEDDAASAAILKRALEMEGMRVEVRGAAAEPIDQLSLLDYSLVILSNVPASAFTDAQREALAVYVRDLGGGLVMVGGDNAFGAGGWLDTPVEDVMPVQFDVKSKRQIPKGALALVMHACEIPQGNYWAERVAVAAVKTLSSRDLVGILSYQWQDATQKYWDVPLQQVGDKTKIINRIKNLAHGDLPDLDPLMSAAATELAKRDDAAVKHMIVISDFDPNPPRNSTIKVMKDNKITCSTIAIGFGSHFIDTNKAQWIAKETGGKYYSTKDYRELPQIFIKESQIVRRSLLQELTFTPQLISSGASTVRGLSAGEVPQLDGYVLTTKKPLALTPMIVKTKDGDDPILAQWQVGLGKSVAFTSGMWTRWGDQWASWPQFSKLWGQIARWASRQPSSADFNITKSVSGGRGRVRVEALNADAAALNFLNIAGQLVRPDLTGEPLQLTQVGPGVYEADFDARAAGNYILNLRYSTREGAGAALDSGSLQTGLSVAYSPEYRDLGVNEALLTELANRTGGRVLTFADAQEVFSHAGLAAAQSRTSIWEDLTKLMLLLFLLDVAIRRVAINPLGAARKLRQFIGEMAGSRVPESGEATLGSLKGARAKAREGLAGADEGGKAPDKPARYQPPTPDKKVTEQLSKALDGASELDKPIVGKPQRKPGKQDEGGGLSRLLKAKKEAQDKLREDSDDKP